jgi:hypothetical protein
MVATMFSDYMRGGEPGLWMDGKVLTKVVDTIDPPLTIEVGTL